MDDRPLILKRYHGDDPRLMRAEADGIRRYRASVEGREGWVCSGVVAQADAHNALAIEPVAGDPLSALVRAGQREAGARAQAIECMAMLGGWLARMRAASVSPGEPLDPFMTEYITHCSRRLAALGLGGRLLSGGRLRESERELPELLEALAGAAVDPSFAHGDLVFANIHVARESGGLRLGLIDFANCLTHSHPLNDVYNLRFALQAMPLARGYRAELWSGLLRGLDGLAADEAVHRFFHEYHRRRWLMLQLCSRNPRRWLQAWLALGDLAAPYAPSRRAIPAERVA